MTPGRRVTPALLRLGRRVRAMVFRPRVDEEVDEELDHHLRLLVRDLMAEGWDEVEARREAERRFGDVSAVRSACRDLGTRREASVRVRTWWGEAAQDVAFGLRQVRRHPGFAAVAVTTLALGFGANAAVFSVLRGVVLRPLPYDEPDRLVALWTRYLPSTGLDIPKFPLSGPEIVDYRDASRALETVVPYRTSSRTLTGDGAEPERVPMASLGEGMLDLLGVRPLLGRDFTREEQDPDAPPTILLSHGLWTDRFGADPGVVGSTVTLEGRSTLIAGVMPPDFVFPAAGVRLWETLRLDEAAMPGRGAHWLRAVARLADGATLEGAHAELETVTAAWYDAWEHHASGHFVYLVPLHEDVVGGARGVVLLLMAAVALVLLVACGNVANLFLARAEARQREIAVRTALGAGRGRLARQLIAEGLTLAALGGVAGLALAAVLTPALLTLDPTALPRAEAVRLDGTVLAFTAGVVILATGLFGLAPALQASGRSPARGLAAGRGATAPAHRRFRRGLVAGQAALSLLVVLGAGLAVRSFAALAAEDPGVGTPNRLTFDLALGVSDHPDATTVAPTYAALAERIEAVPGVDAAAVTSLLPLVGQGPRSDFLPEGEEPAAAGVPEWNATVAAVQPDYFDVMDIPLLRGRLLDDADGPDTEPVLAVSQALVDRYWPGQDVLGRRITYDFGSDEPTWIRIVGVVGDVRARMDTPPGPQVYLVHAQLPSIGWGAGRTMTVVARTALDPAGLVPAVRRAVAEIDPRLPMANLRTMEDVAATAVARPRITAALLAGFGLLALLLAAVGIYGVVAYSVARRGREIGVRVALGAARSQVVGLMVREGAAPAVAGVAVGLAAALLAAGRVEGLVYGVAALDPVSFSLLPLALLTVAVLAAWVPARRATRVAPTVTLREE